MANGSDSGEYVVLSKIRPGLKREFAWALKSQSENSSIGRTRSQNRPLNGGGSDNPSNKRFKSNERNNDNDEEKESSKMENDLEVITKENVDLKSNEVSDMAEKVILISEGEEQEPKSDVVDMEINSDDERKGNMVESVIREEELKDTVGNLTEHISKEEPKGKIVVSICKEEAKDDIVDDICEEHSQPDKDQFVNSENVENVEVKLPCNEGDTSTVQLNVVGEGIGDKILPKKPRRRFTRSSLNPKVPLEVSGKEELNTEEVAESDAISSIYTTEKKLEMKMSKKIGLKRFPTKLKDLLDTGLLEGLPVRYLRGAKIRGPTEKGLRGEIQGSGILCYCDMCGGAEVVTPNQFELHAGSSNKRPPEYIFLENGNTLRDVLNACKVAPPEALEVTIKHATGSLSEREPTFCMNCKGSIPAAGNGKRMLLCNTCMVLKEPQPGPVQPTDTSDRLLLPVSVPKSSDQVSGSASRSKGKLTRKDLRMHKLVFEEDVLADGTALAYYARGQKLLEGYKKGAGIFCFCCNTEISPSQFEAHAGWASRRKPYLHIYTSNGVSLHELSIGLAKQRKFSADENDDLCSICADGGDLLLCDNCPRAFHPECVSLPFIPQGTWYCKYCHNMFLKEKFVERNVNAVAAGRVAGIDPIEQITKRCLRIVETSEAEVGGCVLCRGHDFNKSGFGPGTVILCDQCEKEYHVGCLKEHKMDDLKELPKGKWFCSADCSRIHSVLQKLVADGGEKLPDSLLNVIKKKREEKDSEGSVDLDIRWRLLCGKMPSDETRVLLSKAVSIFHDQFDPIADSTTSRLDLIPHMVYGRNLRDQEYGGMYCAILTVNSLVVSAGIFRIFGQEVAELPLVATSSDCQGQGYFGSLFSCIENLLMSLNVKELVLPAADEAESLWTKKFGFEKISPEQLKEFRRHHQMMIFQGTSMLHKPVTKP
ncbi:hypothetical protein LguiB_031432 [Lonicera macranthoides]